MGVEIERKFLIKGDAWRSQSMGTYYRQGYMNPSGGRTVRVRIAGQRAYLTLKGPTQGLTRSEFEYEIPITDAEEILNTLCDRPLIEKIRYRLNYKGLIWEIDEFLGENQGLILAEVELTDEDQAFEAPDWLGKEVTHDLRYGNASLAKNPFSSWSSLSR